MRTQPHEVRCKSCGILLAKIDDTGLTIRRGDLEANFHGAFRAALRCYRSRCRSLNIVQLPTQPSIPETAA
jgi:hypothetical protein